MVEPTAPLARAARADERATPKPLYAVWELTMKCDQPCAHCGSRAGAAREVELSTEEILEVGAALAKLGCREVALIGGEAYLRPDLLSIVESLAGRGLRVVMQTGGRNLTLERTRALKQAGLQGIGVSVDGPREVHDVLRGNTGSFDAAMRAMDAAREAGLDLASNMQINRLNWRRLRETYEAVRARGVQSWQVQLTVPMGNAADRPEWILEPWRILEVIDTLAAIQLSAIEEPVRPGVYFNVFVGNNIGYYGPHEHVLRSRPGGEQAFWAGCKAGMHTIGIESDGSVKGCPSLPSAPYVGGNVRDLSLEQIWAHAEAVTFTRTRTVDELWGFCKTCYYADTCMAGCSWTAHCTLGRRGNNPFCYHRASKLKKRGIRERLVVKEAAPNLPYDFGRLEILEEPWVDAADEEDAPLPKPTPGRRKVALPIV